MAIDQVGDAAVVRTGDQVTVLLAMNAAVAVELRGLLAKVNSEGVGDTLPGLRQLLSDAEAAMFVAFRADRRVRVARPKRGFGLPSEA